MVVRGGFPHPTSIEALHALYCGISASCLALKPKLVLPLNYPFCIVVNGCVHKQKKIVIKGLFYVYCNGVTGALILDWHGVAQQAECRVDTAGALYHTRICVVMTLGVAYIHCHAIEMFQRLSHLINRSIVEWYEIVMPNGIEAGVHVLLYGELTVLAIEVGALSGLEDDASLAMVALHLHLAADEA